MLSTNCLLQSIIKINVGGDLEVVRRQGRKRKQLLHDLKETKGYWKLKEEAVYRTVWRTRFGKTYGPVVRQTME
jgi:hypothetical protein